MEEESTASSITLKKWDPETPYLAELRGKQKKDWYTIYLDQKKTYANSSAFYLDVADFFIEKDQPKTALRILSNIAEMELENHQLLRILAHKRRLSLLANVGRMMYLFLLALCSGRQGFALLRTDTDESEEASKLEVTMPYGPAIFIGVCIGALWVHVRTG